MPPLRVNEEMWWVAPLRRSEAEDDLVCRFGPDFFRGARFGALAGLFSCSFLAVLSFFRLKKDQFTADCSAGFSKGVRNPDFPKSVIWRGLRTQPMLAVSCMCLQLTCILKTMKAYLAHQRCLEFDMDDIGYDLLADLASEEADLPKMLEEMVDEIRQNDAKKDSERLSRACQSSLPENGGSFRKLAKMSRRTASLARPSRYPSFNDGVAVGLMGTVFDCYLPQNNPSSYYNMRFGYGI